MKTTLISYTDKLLFSIRRVNQSIKKIFLKVLNPIQDGLFRGCSRMGGDKKAPLPKIHHTYSAMMKLGTVIPYLKKIQKIYESRDTPLEFC